MSRLELAEALLRKADHLPEELEELRFLTPFAVAFRYELYEEDEDDEPFGSERVSALLNKLRVWAASGSLVRSADQQLASTSPPASVEGKTEAAQDQDEDFTP